jgi:hypothetical protein
MPEDINQLTHRLVTESTKEKNPHAVELGRLGGKKGGAARAKKLSSRRRKAIARKAAKKRWEAPPQKIIATESS